MINYRFILLSFFSFLAINTYCQPTKINIKDASKNIGKEITICHEVNSVIDTLVLTYLTLIDSSVSSSPPTISNPDPIIKNRIRIMISPELKENLAFKPLQYLKKNICITGFLTVINQLMTITLENENQLIVK